MQFSDQLKAKYEKYKVYWPATFFLGGFVFDVVTLSRIDDWLTMVQQATYLFLIGFYISLEFKNEIKEITVPRRIHWLWTYRDEIVHFMFGSLLSVYVLFYFKSSSLVVSFIFITLLAVVMVANEFSRFQESGVLMRITLLCMCTISYFGYVIPVFVGRIGFLPYIASLAAGTAPVLWLLKRVERKNGSHELTKRARKFVAVVPAVFLLLYLFQLIPPVPLSAKYVGVYHEIEKSQGQYILRYDRPWWAFWENGAQTFLARPGDRVFVFASVFSPTGFRDDLKIRWLYHDERRGWVPSDAIPLSVSGGSDRGYRGYAVKSNYQPGRWRVQIETSDGREISRINLRIVQDANMEPREFQTDTY